MRFYNTLTRSVEEFVPQSGNAVTMYTCGPTVYDRMHIGNLRTFVFSDILAKTLKNMDLQVKSVQNITDIDDKIIQRAIEKKKTVKDVADEFTKYFIEDIHKLNIEGVKQDMPKVSEYIDKIAAYIKDLVDMGYAYEKDGSVYFDISKFPDYGKLSRIENVNLKTGTRLLSDNYTKDDVQDFALWKKIPEGEVGSYKSNLGWGRPGWHIECSVMSQDRLGETIDLHLGGVDLVFPHHENEIAQAEAKTGKKFSRFFLHGAFMLVDGTKMSKSLNNFYTLDDVIAKGFEPLALRYLYLQTHYRQEMNFTWEALNAAQNALIKLRNIFLKLEDGEVEPDFENSFKEALNDDLNFPKALGLVWDNLKKNPSKQTLLLVDSIFDIGLANFKKEIKEVTPEIKKLLEERETLRKEKKFEDADRIREQIIEMGHEVEDLS